MAPVLRRAPFRTTDGEWIVPQSQGSQPRNASSQRHIKPVRTADGTWAVPCSQEQQSTQAPSDAFKDSSPPHEIGGYTSDSNLPSMMNPDSSPAHLPDYGNYRSTTISATDNGSLPTSAVDDDQHETIQPGELNLTYDIRSTPPVLNLFDLGQTDELPGAKDVNLSQENDGKELSEPSMMNNNLQSDIENGSFVEKEDEDPSYQPSEAESRPSMSQTTVSSEKKRGTNPRALQAEVKQLDTPSKTKTTTVRVPVRKNLLSTKPQSDTSIKLPSSQQVKEDIDASLLPVHNIAKRLYEKRTSGSNSKQVIMETQTEQPWAKATTRRVAKRPYFEPETLAEDPQNNPVPYHEKASEISLFQANQPKKTDAAKYQEERPSQTEPFDAEVSDPWDMERSPEPPTASDCGKRTRVSAKPRIKKPKAKSRQNTDTRRKHGSRAVPESKSQPQFYANTVDPIEDSAMEELHAKPPAAAKKQTLVQKMRKYDRTSTTSSSKKLMSDTTPLVARSQTKRKYPAQTVTEQTGSKTKKTRSPELVVFKSKSSPSKGQPSEEERSRPTIIHFDPQIGAVVPNPQKSENQLDLAEKQPEGADVSGEEESMTETVGNSQLSISEDSFIAENIKPTTDPSRRNEVPIITSAQVEDSKKETLAPRHLPFRKRGEPQANIKKGMYDEWKLDRNNRFEKKRRIRDEDGTEPKIAACKRPIIETDEHTVPVSKESQIVEGTTPWDPNIPSHKLNMERTALRSDQTAYIRSTGSQILPLAATECPAIDKNTPVTANVRKQEDIIREQNDSVPPTSRDHQIQKPNQQVESNPSVSNHTIPTTCPTDHGDNQPSLVFMEASPSDLGAKTQSKYGTHQYFPSNQALYLQLQGSYDRRTSNAEFINEGYLHHPRFHNYIDNYISRELPNSSDDVFLPIGDTIKRKSSSFMDKLRQDAQACDESQFPVFNHTSNLSSRQSHNVQAIPIPRSPVEGIRNHRLTKAGNPGIPREPLIDATATHLPNIEGREHGNPITLHGKATPDSLQLLHPRARRFGQELAKMNYLTDVDHWKDTRLYHANTHAERIRPAIAEIDRPTELIDPYREIRPCNGRQNQASGSDLNIQQDVRRRWQESVHAASNSLADSMHNINRMLLNHLFSKEESMNNIVDEYKGNGQKIATSLLQRQKKELDDVNTAFRKDCRELSMAYSTAFKTTRDLRSIILAKSKGAAELASEKRHHLQTARAAINTAREELKAI